MADSKDSIVIGYAGLKRALGIPFAICGGREVLRQIANTILMETDEGFSYGWVDIVHRTPSEPNMPPRSWEE